MSAGRHPFVSWIEQRMASAPAAMAFLQRQGFVICRCLDADNEPNGKFVISGGEHAVDTLALVRLAQSLGFEG